MQKNAAPANSIKALSRAQLVLRSHLALCCFHSRYGGWSQGKEGGGGTVDNSQKPGLACMNRLAGEMLSALWGAGSFNIGAFQGFCSN